MGDNVIELTDKINKEASKGISTEKVKNTKSKKEWNDSVVDGHTNPNPNVPVDDPIPLKLNLELIQDFFDGYLGKAEEYQIFQTESEKIIDEYVPGMTTYQILNGVLSDVEHPTLESKYQQCILEVITRRSQVMTIGDELQDLMDDYEELTVDLEETADKLQKLNADPNANPYDITRTKISMRRIYTKLRRLKRSRDNKMVDAYRLVRESNLFLKVINEIKPQLRDKPENYVNNYALEEEKYRKKLSALENQN